MSKRKPQIRTFRCTVCGTRMVATKARGKTGIGHIKHMWCFMCKERTEHIQIDE